MYNHIELAAYLLGYDHKDDELMEEFYDDPHGRLEEELQEKFEITYEGFEKLIDALLPMVCMGTSFDNKTVRGFGIMLNGGKNIEMISRVVDNDDKKS